MAKIMMVVLESPSSSSSVVPPFVVTVLESTPMLATVPLLRRFWMLVWAVAAPVEPEALFDETSILAVTDPLVILFMRRLLIATSAALAISSRKAK